MDGKFCPFQNGFGTERMGIFAHSRTGFTLKEWTTQSHDNKLPINSNKSIQILIRIYLTLQIIGNRYIILFHPVQSNDLCYTWPTNNRLLAWPPYRSKHKSQ
jgi:hypothetical protein